MFRLVREALSLRQKVVLTRQSLLFLQRCKATEILPRFILNKQLGSVCGLPDKHPKIKNIYRSLLNVVIREKQHLLYSMLLKCEAKEESCRRLLSEEIWRRIEGESKRLCDLIRSDAKATLCAKYNSLRDEQRVRNSNNDHFSSNFNRSEPQSSQQPNIIPETARVTIVGDAQISSKAMDFLSLGPSFSLTQTINPLTIRKIVCGLQKFRDQLRTKTRRDSQGQVVERLERTTPTPIPFPRSFYKESDPFPEADIKFRILSTGVLNALNRFKCERRSNLTREQWEGFKEIRERIKRNEVRLSVSDKGGEFVVLPQSLDREITELHLTDTTVYRNTTEKAFHTQTHKLNTLWVNVGKMAKLDERLIRRLKLENPTCPVFYSLIKTHKLSAENMQSPLPQAYKIRPIISCVNGPTDRISWFLNKIIGQLLVHIPSHLSNTGQFLDRLRACRFQRDCVVESFDVSALYTNVSNNDALQAVSEMLDQHERNVVTFGLGKAQIMALIKECLNCNIFKWSGRYFSQIRGLAMGQRLAPVLAVCFMSRIEQPVLARLPIMYCRYIDDCFVITSTQSEMDELFNILNSQSQYIKLTREVPHEGWLPFLNTQVRVASGTYSVKWYRKGSSKNIIIHAMSAHPRAVKRAVLRNMYRTAVEVCTGNEEREESRRLAHQIANLNGYTTRQHGSQGRSRPFPYGIEDKIYLQLPFISDRFSAVIQQCLERADLANDVFLVNMPRENIKHQLVRNRLYDRICIMDNCVICPYGKVGDCAQRAVVYQLQCLTCDACYIGETGRQLCVRVKEHLASKRRNCSIAPLGKHRREGHAGCDFDVKCTILAYEDSIGARKTLEAFWIRHRNPSMNNKNECINITGDLLPFIPLCEL
uniref:Reverse transcriptase domain-containing protein n=1 Tax=Haemonchus contortus TaxID=6289 RepID=A0A7I4Z2R7_HAECO